MDIARQTIESAVTSFASAANKEQFLFAKTAKDWSARHAYDNAQSVMTKLSLDDLEFSSDEIFDRVLWPQEIDFVVSLEEQTPFKGFFHDSKFSFWREWRQGFIDGLPLNWDLQWRIALINENIWDAGPDAVATEIERVRARWEAEKALTDLSDSLSAQVTARQGIGGNNPPESIQDELLVGSITLIWEAKEELSTAFEEENPDRARIEAILVKFKSGLGSFLKWCASKGDLAVDTLIKWGVPAAGAGYAAKYPEKLEALIDALERWLPYLH
ncbi:hypothetical protein [Ruegeria sp. A3M17]|uniref:hypothetical protein n=1 Tax=Ruegeria sp. A3M17 TaxID=2267229 RepID=UPI000DEA0AD5|nr:hypothetical protein [Ruegeria sp. A3M17]RBW56220.1 hypothetical protein DS906_12485 [Ruegeria sp. A3M17]